MVEKFRNEISTDKGFDEDIFIALFRKSAYEYLEAAAEESDVSSCSISDMGEKRLQKLIGKQIRKDRTINCMKIFGKIAAVVLVVLAICSVTIISVEAWRVPVYNLLINTNKEITKINTVATEEEITDIYASAFKPLYLPDGFKLVSTEYDGLNHRKSYMNEDGDSVIIHQNPIGGTLGINTEDAEYANITINGYEAFYVVKQGISQLYFLDEEHSYFLRSTLDIDELIKIAENIK